MPADPFTRRARLLAPLACSVVAVAVALPASGAGSPSSLRQQAQQLEQENGRIVSQSREAVLTLYSLDSRLTRVQAELTSLRAQAEAVEQKRIETRRELAIARHVVRASQRHLAERLRTLYEQGDSDPLTIVLGAKTLDDAVSGLESANAAAASDRSIVGQARESRAAYTRLQRKLARRAEKLRGLEASALATADALASAKAERLSYIRQLAARRSLNNTQIGSLESQAQAIEAQAQRVAVAQAAGVDTTTATSAPAPVAATIPTGARTLTVTATAYTLTGTTATGAPVGFGVVAVDPSVIALGTGMTIPDYGEGVAADTGGGIQGAAIDLWFPSAAEAAAWGRRTVTITLH